MKTTLALLRQFPFFASLPATDLTRLADFAVVKDYTTDDSLTRAGEIWPYLFLIADGKVNAIKDSIEGRSLVVAELEKGDIFWGLAFFLDNTQNPVTLQFTCPSTAFLWHKEKILPLMLERGKLTWELSQLMVVRMLQASQVIEELAFTPVAGRLARLLLDYPGKGESGPISRSLTLEEMAARIGSTREVVCRFLQRFADAGMIRITRTEFEITDGGKLTNVALKVKS
jgi:CRP/FNR family transcriptional regulator